MQHHDIGAAFEIVRETAPVWAINAGGMRLVDEQECIVSVRDLDQITGLDRKQARQLHPVGIEILAMDGLGPEQQVIERQVVDCLRRLNRFS